jgi:hypothetical protein
MNAWFWYAVGAAILDGLHQGVHENGVGSNQRRIGRIRGLFPLKK